MLNRRSFHLGLAAAGLTFGRAHAQPGVSVPFREQDGRLLVNVRVDGQGPYPFMIDTGADVGLISSSLAQSLRLPYVGMEQNSRGDTLTMLTIGRLDIKDGLTLRGLPYVAVPDGDFTRGSVGCGLLTSRRALVDFDRGMIDFPGGHAGFTALNTHFMTEKPPYASRFATDVTIDGLTLPALWDTGNGATLQVSDTVARQLGLWRDDAPYAPQRAGHVGGADTGMSRIVRAKSISVGPYRFEQQLVLLRYQAVNRAVMGLSLIKTMNFAIDPAGAVFVRRNAQAPGTTEYPRSGIWLDRTEAGVVVGDVGYGSPAARAGVRAGDMLAGISRRKDGNALLTGPVGKAVSLSLLRNGQPVKAQFQLEDYL
jgi:serine protease Do